MLNSPPAFARRSATLKLMSLAALAAAAIAASASFAQEKPDGTINFTGGGVGFIAGVNWGRGTLHYQGRDYPLKVSGLSVGEIGANKYDIQGEVYNLKRVSDIEGVYASGAAGATLAAGAGAMEMQNGAGVVIKARASTAGLHAKLGPSGVTIKLK
ncbi:MAG: DUF1134 domain-containing protein [Caulobacteraceae bacterium]|nr:DUF1134 domain-containing protein [Caulobacteraceae bacterium]